jgi:hypothetical protein
LYAAYNTVRILYKGFAGKDQNFGALAGPRVNLMGLKSHIRECKCVAIRDFLDKRSHFHLKFCAYTVKRKVFYSSLLNIGNESDLNAKYLLLDIFIIIYNYLWIKK